MWPACLQRFLEGHTLGGIGHLYSLCHPADFSVVIPEIDLAPFACQAGGMECFYLTSGKVYDLDVVCFMSFPFWHTLLIILNKFKLKQVSWSADS